MKFRTKYFLFPLLFLLSENNFSQNRKIDSLFSRLKTDKEDTNKINTLNLLSWLLKQNKTDTAIILGTEALTCAEKLKWQKGIAGACHNLGWYNYIKGKYNDALKYYFRSVKINQAIYGKKGSTKLSSAFGNIGYCYTAMGNYPEAVNYLTRAIKMDEELQNLNGMARQMAQLGILYDLSGDDSMALVNHFKCFDLYKQTNNKPGLAYTLGNMAIIYRKKRDYKKALDYYDEAMKLNREIGDNEGLARNLGNIGNLYGVTGDYKSAELYMLKSLDIRKTLGNIGELTNMLSNLGSLYGETKEYVKAKKFLNEALEMAKTISDKAQCREIYGNLASVEEKSGEFQNSFQHFKLHVIYKDSLQNEENTKKIVKTLMQYEFDKESAADSIKNSEAKKFEEVKHQQEISKQKTFTYGGIAGFLVMIVVAAISYNAFRNKKKANIEIQRQKHLVEEKQKEILDSIYYARRIQRALITNEKYIERTLNELNRGQK